MRTVEPGRSAQEPGAHPRTRRLPATARAGASPADARSAAELTALQRTAGNAATATLVQRHAVAGTPVHRHTRTELFDPPGTTLNDFERSLEVQADWFAEPSLTAADRADLHALLARTREGPHILAGVGDLLLSELRGVAAGDWPALAEYGRGRRNTGDTVRLIDPAPRPLTDRIRLGATMIDLKAALPRARIGDSVSEAQLLDVQATALVPAISAYVAAFDPNLEMRYEPVAGARPREFQNLLDLLRGPGTAPFGTLSGWIRDLHRFPIPMLVNLVANVADRSRGRPVHLIIMGSRDAAGAFQDSMGLFASLVADPRNLHLVVEGADTIANLTTRVPAIAASHGKRDGGGTPRIAQVMLAGHGEATSVSLAQNDDLDIDPADPVRRAQSQALLDALMTSMDPATARVVYAGCLVGSNPVPVGTAGPAIAGHIAANPNLAAFTEQRAAAAGIPAGRVQGARASVALGASSSLMDASGGMAIQYDFDPTAYGSALTYVATGHEPEGLFRSAVEVAAASGPVVAETQLRTRLAAGADPGHGWFDQVIVSAITVGLAGVGPGTGVPIDRLNRLAHMVGPPFLVGNSEDGHGRTVGTLVRDVNPHPEAGALYAQLGGQSLFTAPTNAAGRNARMVIEQAWLAQGGARAGALIGWLDGTATADTGWIGSRLDAFAVQAQSSALFPAGAVPTSGRIRLALAWLHADPGNPDVQAFLSAQVVRPATGPELAATVRAELGGISQDEVLTALGVIATAPVAPGVPGAPALPAANAQVRRGRGNEVRVEPHSYRATVSVGAAHVRTLPGMHGRSFAIVHLGDALDVAGFTHNWAAIDRNGRLGFILRTLISPP
ncbi:MAG: hypothetical protein ACK5MT_03200 [Actinomycetales bacterium]